MSNLERHIVVKLFHNKELQRKYLNDILPSLFMEKEMRYIVFQMKRLYKDKVTISVDNILFISNDLETRNFLSKNLMSPLTAEELSNIVFDMTVSSSDELFEKAYLELHDIGFAKFVENSIKDINYELGYSNRSAVLARTRSIEKAHNIIFASKLKNRRDDIGDAFKSLATMQFQPFFSPRLTALMGGFSKGFPSTVIGRPSHAKSTLISYDTCWNIRHEKLSRIDWFSPEEPPKIFWYRIFAHELKIDMNAMLHGLAHVTREQIQKIRKLYEDKIHFHEVRSLQDFADAVSTLKTERIVLDHVNVLGYPRGDQYTGIISLVDFEKSYLAKNNETVIINLSQVNTKEMLKKGRLIPAAEDAYQSTVLQQASREFLSIYYPLKDLTDKNMQKFFVGKAQPVTDGIEVHISKNSFGEIGYINLKFHPSYCSFEDYPRPGSGEIAGNVILGEQTMDMFQDLLGDKKKK